MNLQTLELYCNVVTRNSFSRGAADSGVTQSAASQAVRQLEEELGVRLLDRSKRPFAVTAEGERFHRACRELLDGFQRVRAELAGGAGGGGTVRVAAIYSVGLHDMGAWMERFRRLYPGDRVRLECLHPEAVVRAVLDDAADVGIVSYPQANRLLSVIPLKGEPMQLVCHPRHRLAGRPSVRPGELEGEPFVAFDADLSVRRAVDRFLRRAGVRVKVVMEFDNVESIKQALALEPRVGILPEHAVQKEVATGTLAVARFEGAGLTRPIGLIHRRGKPLGPAAVRFIEMLRQG